MRSHERQPVRRRFSEVVNDLNPRRALEDLIRRTVREELESGSARYIRDVVAEQVDALHRSIRATLENAVARLDMLQTVDETRAELLRLHLATRRLIAQELWRKLPAQGGAPLEPSKQEYNELLAELRKLHPAVFPLWARINFNVTPKEFARNPQTSCALGKRATDEPFAGFVAPHLHGRVLDVGCGPWPLPIYVRGYPLHLLYGVDPLEPFEPHPFTFARGFAEFIPFPDGSFDTVIAATSLDHTLSLTQALSEVRRVLARHGTFLVWDGFVKGSPPYDPNDPGLQPVDDYHLFHFDESWFESLMRDTGFSVREKVAFDPSPHAPQYCVSYFYALTAD